MKPMPPLGAGRSAAPTPRLMLTGFGPFPGIPVNASGRLVEEVAHRARGHWPGLDITAAVLPTEWRDGPKALESALKHADPDVALHFGVASATSAIRIEAVAENRRLRQPDAIGYVPRSASLSRTAPPLLHSTFPTAAIHARLTALGVPVEMSTDAGRYLCNATLFRSLRLAARARRPRLVGFVHIPAALGDPEAASSLQDLDWRRAVDGALAIVDTCLAHACAGLAVQA